MAKTFEKDRTGVTAERRAGPRKSKRTTRSASGKGKQHGAPFPPPEPRWIAQRRSKKAKAAQRCVRCLRRREIRRQIGCE